MFLEQGDLIFSRDRMNVVSWIVHSGSSARVNGARHLENSKYEIDLREIRTRLVQEVSIETLALKHYDVSGREYESFTGSSSLP